MEGVSKVYDLKRYQDNKKTYNELEMFFITNIDRFGIPYGSGSVFLMLGGDYFK